MKFAHIADTHIRNLKFHKEYREVFAQLYKKLQKLKPDYIIHCGDIAHTKTQISPEFVEMCSDFLKNLADIAPTYVILGNHDGNLKNSSRQDALTPIVNALEHDSLYLLKDSGEVILNDQFAINVLSVFDRDNWQDPTDNNRVNIGLYHGSISGIKTDTGWVMEHGENDISIFNNFDYGFLGDIHKTNQSLNESGTIRYCGSTVQQNHGESNDKGFLVWDIQDKDNYTCEHHILLNPKPFISLGLTPKGRLPQKPEVQKGARLRLISENNLPLDAIRRAVDAAKVRFKPESVTYLNRNAGNHGSVDSLANKLFKENLRDIAVQEELIKEYLSDYQPDDDTLASIFEMNKKYNMIVEKEEETKRNVNWQLKSLEWDNLFNYGEGNKVQFSSLDGIVGILGKNFSGKSSVIDSLLYTLYNTTSKKNRKNYNIINQNEENARGKVQIDIGTKTYTIERKSTKYVKRLKGKETNEAKTDVEFTVFDNATEVETSLNGITRLETDKNIRKVFGTLDDFLTTSMASQLESLSFINEGSVKRKETLAKFLDLEFFEQKFKLAKEESSDLKGAIKKMQDRDFDADIKESDTELARVQTELMNKQRLEQEKLEHISDLKSNLANTQKQIDSVPEEVVDIKKVLKNLKKIEKQAAVLKTNLDKKQEEFAHDNKFLQKIETFLGSFDIENVNSEKQTAARYREELREMERDFEQYEKRRVVIDDKISFMKAAPCSLALQDKCQFISDVRRAADDLNRVKIGMNQLTLVKNKKQQQLDNINEVKLDEYSKKYTQLMEKRISVKDAVSKLEVDIEKDKLQVLKAQGILKDLKAKEALYEQHRDAIENVEGLVLEKDRLLKKIDVATTDMSAFRGQIAKLHQSVGREEERNQQIKNQKQDFEDMQKEFTAAHLFMTCMHANGISYDIIKKRLPIINDEIAKTLSNIVDFEVNFENDDKKLDIAIKHPAYDARPIEMGSGAEKTIAAMAIRLALLNVSTLPKGDVFILDEPGTALDADNMEGFIRILDMIKTQFKTVLLISHLDSLKDIVDSQIMIEKLEGKAYVNE